MMHEVSSHGGGMTAASSVHVNLFGPHPIVVHGTSDQKKEWVPRLVSGKDQCCFGFTEPDAGLNTTRIKTFAEKAPGGYIVHGQKVWTSTAQVASACHAAGLVVLTCGTFGNVLRFLPPLVIGEDLLNEGMSILEEAFAAL